MSESIEAAPAHRHAVPRRALVAPAAAALFLALLLSAEFLPALSLGFAGDDFELFSMARIGGFSGAALYAPLRGTFVKPVTNLVWAGLVPLLGAAAWKWYALCFLVHLLNASLFGLLAARLTSAWSLAGVPSDGAAGLSSTTLTAAWSGVFAASVWAMHDRLAEALFSVSALNHSLTFTFTITALLALARALDTRSRRLLLAAGLFSLLALLSYEVAVSLWPASVLLVVSHPRGSLRDRFRFAAPTLAAVAALYAALYALIRWQATAGYRFVDLSRIPANLSRTGLGFLHVGSQWVSPGWPSLLVLLAAIGSLLAIVRDPPARLGLAWTLLASLVVALIPESSDRHNYIAFAGVSLAAGRGIAIGFDAGARRTRRTALHWACLSILIVHAAWSFAGSREQAAWYRLKSDRHAGLLETARRAVGRTSEADGAIVAFAWDSATAEREARALAEAGRRLPARFSDTSRPVYVRPEGVEGLVYARDLLNVARADRGEFFRAPDAGAAAAAIAAGTLHFVSLHPRSGSVESPEAAILEAMRRSLFEKSEVPVVLDFGTPNGSGSWRLAYAERTDRAGAFRAEYPSR